MIFWIHFFGGFVVLTSVVVGPPLIATFFVAAEHGMVPLSRNKLEGGHRQPFFGIYM